MNVKNSKWHTFGCWNAEWCKIQYSPLTHRHSVLASLHEHIHTQFPRLPQRKMAEKMDHSSKNLASEICCYVAVSRSLNICPDSALKCSSNLHSLQFCSCTIRNDGGSRLRWFSVRQIQDIYCPTRHNMQGSILQEEPFLLDTYKWIAWCHATA